MKQMGLRICQEPDLHIVQGLQCLYMKALNDLQPGSVSDKETGQDSGSEPGAPDTGR